MVSSGERLFHRAGSGETRALKKAISALIRLGVDNPV